MIGGIARNCLAVDSPCDATTPLTLLDFRRLNWIIRYTILLVFLAGTFEGGRGNAYEYRNS